VNGASNANVDEHSVIDNFRGEGRFGRGWKSCWFPLFVGRGTRGSVLCVIVLGEEGYWKL